MREDSGEIITSHMDEEALRTACGDAHAAFLRQMVVARQLVGAVEKHMVLSGCSHTPAPGPVGGVNASLHPSLKKHNH